MKQYLNSEVPLGEITKNIGSLFLKNKERYRKEPAFAERENQNSPYRYQTWEEMVDDILKVSYFFKKQQLSPGDRVAFVSSNSYGRLITEMAVMGSGLVSVPIFAGYATALLSDLIKFSKVKVLITDFREKIETISEKILPPQIIWLKKETDFSKTGSPFFFLGDILKNSNNTDAKSGQIEKTMRDVQPSDLALIMYTSGTTNFPKGVQLTHQNLLSQQKALEILWKPKPGMKFLCYLPWHHSFGGLFERFFALHSGGCLAIDNSFGKNIDQLLKNFSEIQPNVYFSVPKVYQEIVAKMMTSKNDEKIFFHPGLKFVFTAAAPLPLNISNIFKTKKIPVVEGWGLTETSPCCTLTKMSLDRAQGIVGFPIPGVEIKIGEEDEILVRGPNVMKGYFLQPEMTEKILDSDGWFKTGDVGKITEQGLKIVSRKDRTFKLSNGEKVFPSTLEEHIKKRCQFIKHAYVFGAGQRQPLLIVFPNFALYAIKGNDSLEYVGCKKPNCSKNFSRCLSQCLYELNEEWKNKSERIQKGMIIERELTIEKNELTPSFKLIPRTIEENYREYIQALEEADFTNLPDDACVVEL